MMLFHCLCLPWLLMWRSQSFKILSPVCHEPFSLDSLCLFTNFFHPFNMKRPSRACTQSPMPLTAEWILIRNNPLHFYSTERLICLHSSLCLLTCSLAIMLTLLFQIHFLMILSSNWAYLKDASKMQAYQDIKAKEEQELQDIQSRSKEQLNSYT